VITCEIQQKQNTDTILKRFRIVFALLIKPFFTLVYHVGSGYTALFYAVLTSEIKLKQNNFVAVLFQTWLHVK